MEDKKIYASDIRVYIDGCFFSLEDVFRALITYLGVEIHENPVLLLKKKQSK